MRINRGFIGELRERLSTVTFLVPTLILVLILSVGGFAVITKNRALAATCPCNVFNETPTPNTFQEPTGIELGFKFRASIDGYISGIRFFKTSNMGGTHTASLWNNAGQRITQATFESETATGWQEVNFAPVAVTANTIYTASVFMANGQYNASGNYFTNDIVTDYLTAPRNGAASDVNGANGQGVFNASGSSVYPTSSFNATNYWIDVSFVGSIDSGPPEVSEVAPANGSTDVNLGDTVTATFDRAMDSTSISASTFLLKDSSDNSIPGAVSYNAASKKASLVVDGGLMPGETYTATLKGGSTTPVIQSLNGAALASDYVWSFTTSVDDSCPCTLKNGSNPAGAQTFDENLPGVELGVKVVPEGNGYIQSLRFYKPILSGEVTHVGSVWDKNGSKLASVTFTGESDYGWQEAKFSTPVRVYEGQPYILSYGTTEAIYVTSIGALNTTIQSNGLTAYATGDSRNAANGSGNGNGVFSTTIGAYPSSASTNGSYYWIDAVFTNEETVTIPLKPVVSQPLTDSYGVARSISPSVVFDRPLDAATINGTTVQLLHNGAAVTGTASYNVSKHAVNFSPASPLESNGRYTLRLTTEIADSYGVHLGDTYEVTFTVGSEHMSNMTEGLGGPVLVLTSSTDPYGQYYAEILKTEGITYFDVKDSTELSDSLLKSYKLVILAQMELTQAQVEALSAWVNEGGNLVAMRPDKKLAGLLGLSDDNSMRTNQYLKVDTADTPGAGITAESMQFKGVGDNYSLTSALSVADFYSDASTATSNPAVSYREVGFKGGTAAAFMYDLAKSVIAQHQGNRAWAGTERDGSSPVRTNDLFYGAKAGDIQPDWTDMNKIHIPQADEQQRLLVNIMTKAMKDTTPMPRFWYLPHDNKAALVMAGDDHSLPNQYGTQLVMNNWLNESPTHCSVSNWECVRASHYVYPDSGLSNDRAVQYDRLGFEIGLHPLPTCGNFASYDQLSAQYLAELNEWRAKYTGLPDAQTSRVHCYAWSGWDMTTQFENTHTIKYDLNYVAFPATWIGGRSPLLTGSGMNMRLTLADGSMANVRQGVTNFDNTAASSGAINAALDNAVGPAGYYGIFGTHYDMSDTYDRLLLNAAKSRGIPMITAKQAFEWLEGRENSRFDNLKGTKGRITFTLQPAENAIGLKAMIPIEDSAGTLISLKRGGASVSYRTEVIKGINYATFDANSGDYEVIYSDYDVPNNPNQNQENPPGGDQGSPEGGENSGENRSTSEKRTFATENSVDDLSKEAQQQTTGNEPGSEAQLEGTEIEEGLANDTIDVNWWIVIGVPMVGVTLLGFLAWRRRHHTTV